jgi:SAM-dependent methyltransferase
MSAAHSPADLQRIYEARFENRRDYRRRVWTALTSEFFQRWIPPEAAVLDVGCGYGEFINLIRCKEKWAMDLNPKVSEHLDKSVKLIEQDCSAPWPLKDKSLDAVFSSNFFEHLPDKASLGRTFDEILRCLAPGGRLIAMGPNIKYLPGRYWEFWDHYVPLTENSMKEALETRGFEIELCEGRFLPFKMNSGPEWPVTFLRAYLKFKPAWALFGKQFLVIARKPLNASRS